MKNAILASALLLSLNLFASENSGNIGSQAAAGDFQNAVKNNAEVLTALKQSLVDANKDTNQICLTGQWLMLDVINMKERRNFLDSVGSNLIESFDLNPNDRRKENIRQLYLAYQRQIESMRFYMSPNQNAVESLIDKEDERACAANTLNLTKQIEKMMVETQNGISAK